MEHGEVVIILRDQTDKLISSLPEYQLKLTAALTVVLGWLLTSEGARNYIGGNAIWFKLGIISLLACLGIIHAIWIKHHYRQAEGSYLDLKKYVEENQLFRSDMLRLLFLGKHIVPTYIFGNAFMLIAIGTVVLLA
jgi:hypothetical protein